MRILTVFCIFDQNLANYHFFLEETWAQALEKWTFETEACLMLLVKNKISSSCSFWFFEKRR